MISFTIQSETPFPWLLIPLELMSISQVLKPLLLCTGMFAGGKVGKGKCLYHFPGINSKCTMKAYRDGVLMSQALKNLLSAGFL